MGCGFSTVRTSNDLNDSKTVAFLLFTLAIEEYAGDDPAVHVPWRIHSTMSIAWAEVRRSR